MIVFTESVALNPAVRERIAKVAQYLQDMERERLGTGADDEVGATALSFVRALNTLIAAERVWTDGPGMSFGGVLPDGTVFGMIARTKGDSQFPAIEWTFHS